MNHAVTLGNLPDSPCVTRTLHVHGYHAHSDDLGALAVYGEDAARIRALETSNRDLSRQLHPALPISAAQVVWAVREEMARSVEDVLSRRTRALLLNARAAIAMAPAVAGIMAGELDRDAVWVAAQVRTFEALAVQYLPL